MNKEDIYIISGGDFGCIPDAYPFLYKDLKFIKKTRSGLYQMSLKSDPKKTYSFPKRNIINKEIYNEKTN